MNPLEAHHRRALARELTAAAGAPLRDRYGFAASDATVDALVDIVFTYPTVDAALVALYDATMARRLRLAMDHDTPTDEDYERRIVVALQPLVADWRRAAHRWPAFPGPPDNEEDGRPC